MDKNQSQIKAALYCRVSSREQEETGYSLDAQEKLLRDYATRKGFTIVKVFSMAESASGAKQRKVFDEMIKFTEKNKVANILCEKVDRLTRNLKDALAVNDWLEAKPERQVHFVKTNLVIHKDAKSDEKFRLDIEIVLAKKYIANLSEEVRKGQAEKIAQGGLPTKPPIGYKTIGDKGHKIHVIDGKVKDKDGKEVIIGAAAHIKKMFELYATGNYSLLRLEKELYEAGLRTRSGKTLRKSRLYLFLKDPFYKGSMRWKGTIYPGSHEALIAKDLFDKVQVVLRRQSKNPKYEKHNALFKSRIFCQHCGGMVTWYEKKGRYYGHCNNSDAFRNCPKKTGLREDRVEEQLAGIFDVIAPKDERVLKALEEILIAQHADKVIERENEVKHFNTMLIKLRQQKDKMYEAKINREVPVEYCDRKLAELTKEETTIEEALVTVSDKSDEFHQLSIAVHELAYKTREIYDKATVDEKQLLFSQIFTNLTQNELKIKETYTNAAQLLADWMPRLNKDYELLKAQALPGQMGDLVSTSTELRKG